MAIVDTPNTPNTDLYFNCSNDTDTDIRIQDDYQYIFTAKSFRDLFIRKLFGVLILQLCSTLGIICFFLFYEPVAVWIRLHSAIVFCVDLLALILLVVLACCGEGAQRRHPGNIIFLLIFTLAQGISMGVTATRYSAYSVILSFGIILVVCLAVVLFSLQVKVEFMGIGGYLFVTTIALILHGTFALCIRHILPFLSIILSSIFALLFCLYLVYDTQMMVGGKHNSAIKPEEYIYACLSLYLDILNNFLYVICIFGSNGDD